MLTIENHTLTIDDQSIALPRLTKPATVRAWRVPTEYRENGLFVAVTPIGEPQEIPACDLRQCEYLGELELDAGDDAKLEAVKAAKRLEINDACNAAVASLAASYPEREIQSWPQQVKEAEALAANPQAQAPLLAAIAEARGLPVVELASRVLGKMNAYAAASGSLIGQRQAAEAAIMAATTVDELDAIEC